MCQGFASHIPAAVMNGRLCVWGRDIGMVWPDMQHRVLLPRRDLKSASRSLFGAATAMRLPPATSSQMGIWLANPPQRLCLRMAGYC